MTATNHALTGAFIGLVVGRPELAMPLALGSHFICDALPHYASKDPSGIKKKSFQNYLLTDAGLCVVIVLTLALLRPPHWELAAICAFLAASPDFFWVNHYRTARANRKWHPNAYSKFAKKIQWFQRPIGATVEVAWFIAAIVLLEPLVRLTG
jgi:hypothetical protein